MPTALKPKAVICRYCYDPLDRLVECTPSTLATIQRFYLQSKLVTEIQGQEQSTFFQHNDQLLAQQQRQSVAVSTTLLLTDQQRSILHTLGTQERLLKYTPYGHREISPSSLLEFNGERRDPVTGHYLLGNGYRAYNPVLMRFNSPDNLSPFKEGGRNPYAYCLGDPVNHSDPTGHFIAALLTGLSTKAIGIMGGGISVAVGFTADTLNMSRSLVYAAATSGVTAAAAVGLATAPATFVLTHQVAHVAARAAYTAATTLAVTMAVPAAARAVVHVGRAVQPILARAPRALASLVRNR
ncbi:RHS repeat-associated core domain-containing protein [Pseudomonas sp. Irchel s3a18]|uniref:RHS repeat-associated core domain-containing protein n=1 Tax=Pseudomonas sp. Irchel s3a18 TaxID=2009053 RepID=UPI000BA37AFA|nr:RHS repeat-associated core domain-containing protein [Pseudomonas sp. Irchel s3a18]